MGKMFNRVREYDVLIHKCKDTLETVKSIKKQIRKLEQDLTSNIDCLNCLIEEVPDEEL